MRPQNIALIGCGDLGLGLAHRLQASGQYARGFRRNPGALPPELPSLAFDYGNPASYQQLERYPWDAAVFTPTPAGRGVAGYRAGYLDPVKRLLEHWQQGPARNIIYISSTRVYGDKGGDWVTEDTPVAPSDEQGALLAEAESRLLDSRHRVSVVRFSGIYGRLPSRLLDRIGAGEICAAQPPRFSNRIHREDCTGFLWHLLQKAEREPVYLASDDDPAPQHEVEQWLAARLGVSDPRERPAVMTANRRCDNRSLHRSGYRLLYPDYRSGYGELLDNTPA